MEINSINYENSALLKVEDLYTYFFTEEGVVRAVDGVSFEIKHNEILGLVGETGCGKSVTALSILQLIRPPGQIVEGSIKFHDEDLTKVSEERIREYRGNKITMIFQDPLNSLNPVMKVGTQLVEVYMLHQKELLKEKLPDLMNRNEKNKAELVYLKNNLKELKKNDENYFTLNTQLKKKISKLEPLVRKKVRLEDVALEEAQKMLDLVGIADSRSILDRYPHVLSGGMRQRVMISMGLACNAEILICDEPTTALDVTIQAQILQLIRDLKTKLHNSVLFITHSLGVIYELCDRVAVMYSGNIVEYGTVEQVMENPLHPYTKGLLAAIPHITDESKGHRLQTIPGIVPNLIYPPVGCRFHPRCPHAMAICKSARPEIRFTESKQKVACYLFDPRINDSDFEMDYRKLTAEEKKERIEL